MVTPEDLIVTTLGPCRVESPYKGEKARRFISDETYIRLEDEIGPGAVFDAQLAFEKAGPRERIFFEPERTTAAIVTCGGLSPGLNTVIRSIFLELVYNYGVPRVLGIREGYRGLNPEQGKPLVELTPAFVQSIHYLGGTVLGSSRGAQEPGVMADFLASCEIDILFCVGGDGTQRGALALSQEVQKRGLETAIVGIPKTIDNDIPYVWMSFGYATAAEVAMQVIRGAHVEALGAPNGIGLVKVMGRNAGFIAAGAALASQEANFVLVPEVPFLLEGERGLLQALERRLEVRGHAVIVTAEGAGQHLLEAGTEDQTDASGNVRHQDIGYIDPSYAIRSVPANAWDRILSDRMARMACHAAMAGKTNLLIGYHHNSFVHIPIRTAVATRRQLDPASDLWNAVLGCTGQPRW
ncbi:MAG: ATP-dependent 6-phosphofructokinase [Planctomycetota bacterium]|jgi:6-phosphofructokinase 1